MAWSIGIDIGGTAIKAIAVHKDGTVIDRITRPTNDKSDSLADWVAHGKAVIEDFESIRGESTQHIGLCAPGLADTRQRWISYLPKRLAGIEGFDWAKALEKQFEVPVLNDAHSALLGESWVGAAQGQKNIVLLTLGTGVGGAILADGRLLKGHLGRAGHLGHMSQDINGPKSIANMPGAIETMIGNATVCERSDGRFSSTRSLVDAYEAGDDTASAIWLTSIRALGCAIASYINILDPEVVVLTGGITTAGDSLMHPLLKVLDEVEWRPGGHRVPIIFGKLDRWAGAMGAAYAALNPESL